MRPAGLLIVFPKLILNQDFFVIILQLLQLLLRVPFSPVALFFRMLIFMLEDWRQLVVLTLGIELVITTLQLSPILFIGEFYPKWLYARSQDFSVVIFFDHFFDRTIHLVVDFIEFLVLVATQLFHSLLVAILKFLKCSVFYEPFCFYPTISYSPFEVRKIIAYWGEDVLIGLIAERALVSVGIETGIRHVG